MACLLPDRRPAPTGGATPDPALLTYLTAENDWCAAATARLGGLVEGIFGELRAALPDEDVSAPWTAGRWEYAVRRPAGRQYPVHVRRPLRERGGERVLLDENLLADGHDFLDLGVCEVSPDGGLLAYSVDHDGAEVYPLRMRDLATGDDLPDNLDGTYYGLGWAATTSATPRRCAWSARAGCDRRPRSTTTSRPASRPWCTSRTRRGPRPDRSGSNRSGLTLSGL